MLEPRPANEGVQIIGSLPGIGGRATPSIGTTEKNVNQLMLSVVRSLLFAGQRDMPSELKYPGATYRCGRGLEERSERCVSSSWEPA